MDRSQALARIETIACQLRSLGVTEVAVFGSVARNEASPGSDVDVLVNFDVSHETFANLLTVADLLESVLQRPVDLLTRNGLSPYVSSFVEQEAVFAQIA